VKLLEIMLETSNVCYRTSRGAQLVLDSLAFLGPGPEAELNEHSGLDERIQELMSFVEEDAKRWDDAANHCEIIAARLAPDHRANLQLQCAVYRERAKMHRDLVAKIRK